MGSSPGLGRCPGEENGNLLQYSCLENSVDRGAWWATVHVSQSWTRLGEHGTAWSVEIDGHALLQGIFPPQGLNPRLLCLLPWQADSLLTELIVKLFQYIDFCLKHMNSERNSLDSWNHEMSDLLYK